MKEWTERMGRGARVLGAVLLSCALVGTAWGQATSLPYQQVTSDPLSGAVGDMLVVSVVDTGLRTGASVRVRVKIIDSSGAIIDQTAGVVTAGAPLRLQRVLTTGGPVQAQVIVPLTGVSLSAPVMTVERWNPALANDVWKSQMCAIHPAPVSRLEVRGPASPTPPRAQETTCGCTSEPDPRPTEPVSGPCHSANIVLSNGP